jgi:hypothetical protein
MLTQMRGLAFNLAERNKIPHNFNKTIKDGRLRLALRVSQEAHITTSASPEPTSLAGTIGFHRTFVKEFFCLLSSLYDK